MVAGLEETSDGIIEIGQREVTHMDPADRGVAMVFQTYALYPHMTVEENMGFGLKMTGHPASEVQEKVAKAAAVLKLEPYLKRRPKALSGGQRQRVAIGRAIVRGPEVFLLDEPLSNLDAELRVDMRVEIARLHKEIGATMIYVTHDQVEAMTLADKIVVLRAGRIEQVGAPLQLYENPQNMFVAGFIGSPSMNFVSGQPSGDGVMAPGLSSGPLSVSANLSSAGSNLMIGLRPQDITLDEAGSTHRVDLTEHLGGVAYAYLTAETGEKIVAEFRGKNIPENGSTIGLSFQNESLHVFDAGTEQRL